MGVECPKAKPPRLWVPQAPPTDQGPANDGKSLARAQMTGASANESPLVVVVPDHEVIESEAGFGRRHAIYRIVCTEGAATWTIRRRWTELRITIDAMQQTHAAALKLAPSFEAHPPFWRLGAAQLEPEFLSERAASMQSLLQALSLIHI